MLAEQFANYFFARHLVLTIRCLKISVTESVTAVEVSIIDEAVKFLASARESESRAMAFLKDITKIQVRRPPDQ